MAYLRSSCCRAGSPAITAGPGPARFATISAASAAVWSGVGPTSHMYGAYSSITASGAAPEQLGPHTIPAAAMSGPNVLSAWAGPPITANGSLSMMARASALAASTSSDAPLPTKRSTTTVRPYVSKYSL